MSHSDFRIGDPIVFVRGDIRILGYVADFGGDEYQGMFPVIHLRTPHGSDLSAGRIWFEQPSDEDLVRLASLDRVAGLGNQFGGA